MTNQAHFDLAAFSGVKPSLDASLGEVSANMEHLFYCSAANSTALQAVAWRVKALSGALKMVHLDGVVVFCTELENVLNEFSANPGLFHHFIGMYCAVRCSA